MGGQDSVDLLTEGLCDPWNLIWGICHRLEVDLPFRTATTVPNGKSVYGQVGYAAGESFCSKTTPHSKLRGVFHMKDQRIKELRDAEIVKAQHVESERNLADRLTKGLSATARDRLDQELDQVRLSLIKLHIKE